MLHYRRILYPVDFSLRCRQMAPLVAEVGRKFFSEVILLHVLDPLPLVCYAPEFSYFAPADFIEKQRQTMSAELEEFSLSAFPALESHAIPVKCVIVTGEPAESIVTQAERNNVDLIMMPTHGRGLFRRLLLGSVTAKVLHDTTCAVWTNAHCERFPVPRDYQIRRILCAVDTGIENVHVLRVAADVAYEYDAQVQLVHAVTGQEAYYENTIDPGLRQYLMRTARERIKALQDEAGTNWELCVKAAPVEDVVRQVSEDYGADLVVIGRGRLKEHFEPMRAHSTAIIRESPCPVLSV
jgi:nucleotide-binding universal stress UspA family protein